MIEDAAEKDLLSILTYIAETLHDPAAAQRLYFSLHEAANGLRQHPLRVQVVTDESYARHGLRRLVVGSYSIFYAADVCAREVHILRVLYNRREWQGLL